MNLNYDFFFRRFVCYFFFFAFYRTFCHVYLFRCGKYTMNALVWTFFFIFCSSFRLIRQMNWRLKNSVKNFFLCFHSAPTLIGTLRTWKQKIIWNLCRKNIFLFRFKDNVNWSIEEEEKKKLKSFAVLFYYFHLDFFC